MAHGLVRKTKSMNRTDIEECMRILAGERPGFHSEADFQHELAMGLRKEGRSVRLEVPTKITLNAVADLKSEVDIVIREREEVTVIELKYVTMEDSINHGGEDFNLGKNWGTNLSRFDCLADLHRVEAMKSSPLGAKRGFSIFLTNAEDAWTARAPGKPIMAEEFRIHEGHRLVPGSLDWNPPSPSVGSVSKKRLHPFSPIQISAEQSCIWRDYSNVTNTKGGNLQFRYLLLEA